MRLRGQGDMDRGLFERLLTEMRAAGVEELGLFYLGESFLVRWLPEAIAFAKGIGFPYVFLTTNGSLAKPAVIRECLDAGLDSLKFSFNYADEAQFEAVAQVKPRYFSLLKENIAHTHRIRAETGASCGLYASYILYDGEQGERMREAVEEVRPHVDEVYALPLYNQASLVTEEEVLRGWAPTAGNRGRADALRDPLPCWSVFTEGHITHDGKLSACCFDHNGGFEMGDLTTTPFEEAWNSATFRDLRAAHLAEDVTGTACESCVASN
jgi:radical SAM protein with 4Fe4S-binding SPASM domain